MALVAPRVMRFSLNGNMGSANRWANIWDVRALGDVAADRGEAARLYAGAIMDVWFQTISTRLSSSVTLEGVSWVDLDTDQGSVGEVSVGNTTTGPYVGASPDSMSPRNVAVLIRKNSTAARGTRAGRMYVPGIPENQAGEGSIGGTALSAWQLSASNFLDALTDPDLGNGFSYLPTVVHTRNTGTEQNPVITYINNTVITSLTVDPILATQRRRLRR